VALEESASFRSAEEASRNMVPVASRKLHSVPFEEQEIEVPVAASSAEAEMASRRVVRRCRVEVESLQPDGLASGQVVQTLCETLPDGEEDVLPAMPERLTFIGGLPGEILEVEVSWSLPRPRRRRARQLRPPVVRVVEVTRASPLRAEPRCGVFGICGGCQLQHLAYPAQLDWKTNRVRSALGNVGLVDVEVLPALGSRSPWNYRNQMRFSINREGQAGLTAHRRRRILPLTDCPIAHPRINRALELVTHHRLRPPQLLVRYGQASNQLLLQPAPDETLRSELEADGVEVRVEDMEECLAGVSFRMRPSSFFQTNTAQAEQMARLVLERVPAGRDNTWVDAYCGVGTFARLIAPVSGCVIAIEESASAVRDARQNLFDAPNVVLVQGKVEDVLPTLEQRLDGLVIDPPRAGCRRPVLDALVARRLPRVIYISCHPDTLARDLALLCLETRAYAVVSVQPLDMFPQTAHIETVTLLEAIP
jgi:23S rRNA (uracil1939-C5)-methyltransferase